MFLSLGFARVKHDILQPEVTYSYLLKIALPYHKNVKWSETLTLSHEGLL